MSGRPRMTAGAWDGLTLPRLTSDALSGLLAGKIPHLRVPNFLDKADCDRAAERFLASRYEVREFGVSRTLQLGMVLVPPGNVADYFSRSKALNEAVDAVFDGLDHPVPKVRQALQDAAGWSCLEPVENGRPYSFNVLMGMPPGSSAPLHCDLSFKEPGLFISRFPRLISWNVYLSAAERGGELVVYGRRWDESKGKQGLPGSQEFGAGFFADAPRSTFSGRTGDLVIFDCSHFHEVNPVEGSRHRILSHSFVSVDPQRGEMAIWT